MKAVLLLSGGIDSPVAGRMLQEQGVELVGLHCSFEPITDDAALVKSKNLASHLGLGEIWVARVGEALARIPHDRDAHKHYFVLQKRLFYRIADQVAEEVGAQVIATGENLGQVSSQTLKNLATLEAAAKRPVLRPLLGLDKNDIIRLAKGWDTFEASIGPELCDVLGPNKPATQSDPERVAGLEGKMGLDQAVPRAEPEILESAGVVT